MNLENSRGWLAATTIVLACFLAAELAELHITVEAYPLWLPIKLILIVTVLVLTAVVSKRQQIALRDSEERFRRMFEGAAIGIGLDGMQGQILESNFALQALLGYSREELNHMTFAEFTHPDDLAADLELFEEMLAGKRDSYQMEKRHICKNGEVIWVRLTNSLVRDNAGKPQFTIGMVEDITERKQAEVQLQSAIERERLLAANLECQVESRTAELRQRMHELQHLNQVKDLLLHAVSHDLKTPIQGTLMFLNKLRRKCGETAEISASMLDCMILSSSQQLTLLNSLLADHGETEIKLTLIRESVQFPCLVTIALTQLQPLLQQNQATVLNQLPETLPVVKVDPAHLQQVLENLVINAIKHNPPGVTITLNAIVLQAEEFKVLHPTRDLLCAKQPLLYCTIEDNGVGMRQEQCDRLFKLYIRGLDNSHLTGIGLGLQQCWHIITAHAGQIGVISQPGAGSKFWFTLPLSPQGDS